MYAISGHQNNYEIVRVIGTKKKVENILVILVNASEEEDVNAKPTIKGKYNHLTFRFYYTVLKQFQRIENLLRARTTIF